MLIQYRQLGFLFNELDWEVGAKLFNQLIIERTNGMSWLIAHAHLDKIQMSLKSTGAAACTINGELEIVRGLREQTSSDGIKIEVLRIEADIIRRSEVNKERAVAQIKTLYKYAINLCEEMGRVEYLADTCAEFGVSLLKYNCSEGFEHCKRACRLYKDLGYEKKRNLLEEKLNHYRGKIDAESEITNRNCPEVGDESNQMRYPVSATPCNN